MNIKEKNFSLFCIAKKIFGDFSDLLICHYDLFKHEMREEALLSVKITLLFIAALLSVFTGFIFLGIFLICLFGLFMPIWLSALCVTLLYFVFSLLSLFIAKLYFEKIKKDSSTVINQTKKTLEAAKKWFRKLK